MENEVLALGIVSKKKLLPADIFKKGQLDPILDAIKDGEVNHVSINY